MKWNEWILYISKWDFDFKARIGRHTQKFARMRMKGIYKYRKIHRREQNKRWNDKKIKKSFFIRRFSSPWKVFREMDFVYFATFNFQLDEHFPTHRFQNLSSFKYKLSKVGGRGWRPLALAFPSWFKNVRLLGESENGSRWRLDFFPTKWTCTRRDYCFSFLLCFICSHTVELYFN